jgi:hypothetical protein
MPSHELPATISPAAAKPTETTSHPAYTTISRAAKGLSSTRSRHSEIRTTLSRWQQLVEIWITHTLAV